jgi:hypothetical protein
MNEVKVYFQEQEKKQYEEDKTTLLDLTRDLEIEHDEFDSSRIWITSKKYGIMFGDPGIMPYIGVKNNNVSLRMVINYYKYSRSYHSWIFVKKYDINVDGKIYTVNPEYDEIDRDNGSNWISERLDINPTIEQENMLNEIAIASSVKIAYRGDDYFQHDLNLTEIIEVRKIMAVYNIISKNTDLINEL